MLVPIYRTVASHQQRLNWLKWGISEWKSRISDTATLFGEDQARYIIASNFDQAEALFVNAREAGVVISKIGTLGGNKIKFGQFYSGKEKLFDSFRTSFAEIFN